MTLLEPLHPPGPPATVAELLARVRPHERAHATRPFTYVNMIATVDGRAALDGRTSRTLIREIQRHPVKRTILHVDFQEVVAGERVAVKIPIVLHGTPEGVRLGGGMLDQVMYELHVQADPANMPGTVEMDVTPLQIAQAVHVRDLSLPEGVIVMDDEGLSVCTVQPPRVSVEAGEEAGGAEPELIRKQKEEEEA